VRETRLRWHGHMIRRDEGKLVKDIMEWKYQKKMWGGRHCREGEGSKAEMIWTHNKKRWRRTGRKHYGIWGKQGKPTSWHHKCKWLDNSQAPSCIAIICILKEQQNIIKKMKYIRNGILWSLVKLFFVTRGDRSYIYISNYIVTNMLLIGNASHNYL
jgi:hypothetical protein